MEWFYIVLIIVTILLLISFIPFKIGMRMYWNVGKNLGVLSFDVWGINILSMQIEITQKAINIIRTKKKERQIQIQALNFGAIFMHHFVQTVFRYLIICEISMYIDLSKKGDAFTTCIANGVAMQFLNAMYVVLYGLKGNFNSFCSVNTDIQENKCSLSNRISVMMAPLILLISAVRAFLRTKRGISKYGKFANGR